MIEGGSVLKEEVVLIYCFEDSCKRVWWGPSTPQVAVTLVVAAALPSTTGWRIFVAKELLQPGVGPCPPLPLALCPILWD